jgi:hypothetical protein
VSAISDPGTAPRNLAELNPDFGRGVLRRRVRLIAEEHCVRAGVEDAYHSFRLLLRHDGRRVTALEPRLLRIPLSTCPTADGPLRGFIGMALDASWRQVVASQHPRQHCTHLHDLCTLAMAHALRGGARRYDVAVPDEHPGPVWSTLHRDGELLLRWRTWKGKILEPAELADRPLLRGFSSWANACLSGDELEAALVMHKGYFVSRARRWNVEASAGRPVADHDGMRGACHSYSEPQMSVAIRNRGTTIDTSDPATPLLEDMT